MACLDDCYSHSVNCSYVQLDKLQVLEIAAAARILIHNKGPCHFLLSTFSLNFLHRKGDEKESLCTEELEPPYALAAVPWKKRCCQQVQKSGVHDIAGFSLIANMQQSKDFFLEDPGANGGNSGIDLKLSAILFALVLSGLWFVKCPLVQQLFQVVNRDATFDYIIILLKINVRFP